jgi:hypothetical protein
VLAGQRDDRLVVQPLAIEGTRRIARWVAGIPGVHVLVVNQAGTLYALPPLIDPASCPATA